MAGYIEDNEWFYSEVVLKHSKTIFNTVLDSASVNLVLLISGIRSIWLFLAFYLVHNDSDIIHLTMLVWNWSASDSSVISKCFRFLVTV